MAGYSGTPLPQKLGIKPGHRVLLLGAREGFEAGTLGPLPENVIVAHEARGSADVIVAFLTSNAELVRRLPVLRRRMEPAAGLWIAWPKRASGVATDLTEDVLREVCLPLGWVDTKVCAVTAVWSGLKFVLRKENRPSARAVSAPNA